MSSTNPRITRRAAAAAPDTSIPEQGIPTGDHLASEGLTDTSPSRVSASPPTVLQPLPEGLADPPRESPPLVASPAATSAAPPTASQPPASQAVSNEVILEMVRTINRLHDEAVASRERSHREPERRAADFSAPKPPTYGTKELRTKASSAEIAD